MKLSWFALALVSALTSCAVRYPEGTPLGSPPECLEQDLEDLRGSFNAGADRHRVMAFLSPTCPYSSRALGALRHALDANPSLRVQVLVIWLDELPEDGAKAAHRASIVLEHDPRVHFYHDGRRRAAMALARKVIPAGAAQRAVLCFDPGVLWDEEPPEPGRVAHQMGRLAPEDYCPPEQLAAVLTSTWE